MTAKEKVLKVYPRARRLRCRTNGGRGYTLIYPDYRASMYIGSGDTTAKAWSDAARLIKANEARDRQIKANKANEANTTGICTCR